MPAARRQRVASWAAGHADRVVFRLLRGLFGRRGVPEMSEEELDRSFALLQCYVAPEILADPDRLFAPPQELPRFEAKWRRPMRGGMHTHFTFRSPYRPVHRLYAAEFRRYDRLDTAHLFAWRHARPAPASILVTHGWGVGAKRLHEREFGIPYLFRKLGLDVYYYVHPFHWVRRPSVARFSGELHPSPNLMRTNETFVQTVQEIRTALSFIEAHNPAPMGMMGSSLGGYTTALVASVDSRLSFAVPVLPPASLADLFWAHGDRDPMRQHAEAMGMTLDRFRAAWALHSPMSYEPQVPFEGRMVVLATGDRIVPREHSERLWRHWGEPRRYDFAGGHILQVYGHRYHREVGRLLADLGYIRPRS